MAQEVNSSNSNSSESSIVWWRFLIEKALTWQFVTLIALMVLISPIKKLVNNTNQLKVGGFQLTVQEIANSLGISNSIEDLNGLSYQELKIFLIVCGEDASYYQFNPTNLTYEEQVRIYSTLKKKGLIDFEEKEGEGEHKGKKVLLYGPTEKGVKIHRVIIDAIYRDLINKKIEDGENAS